MEEPRPEQQDSVNSRFVAQHFLVFEVDVDGLVGDEGGVVGRFRSRLDQVLRLV